MEETAAEDERKNNDPAQYYSFNQTFIYHWDTWETGKYRHVFYIKLGTSDSTHHFSFDGTPRDTMFGMDGNCPSRPHGSFFFNHPFFMFLLFFFAYIFFPFFFL